MEFKYYDILVSDYDFYTFITDLLGKSKCNYSNWNSDRASYICTLLHSSIEKSHDKFAQCKKLLDLYHGFSRSTSIKNKMENAKSLLNFNKQSDIGGNQGVTLLRTVVSLIHIHLSCNKIVKFQPDHQLNFSSDSKKLYKNYIWTSLPDLPKFLWFNKDYYNDEEFLIGNYIKWNKVWSDVILVKGNNFKNINQAINNIRRIVFTNGINLAEDINDTNLVEYVVNDSSTAVRSYKLPILILNSLGSKLANDLSSIDYKEGVKNLSSSIYSERSNSNSIAIESCWSDFKKRLYDNSLFVNEESSFGKYFLGENISVTRKRKFSNLNEFDGWIYDSSLYSIEALKLSYGEENKWLMAQEEFVDSFIEKSTKKGINSSLQLLNLYVFGYLKYFFDENKGLEYDYPDTPEKFLPSIFVKHSKIFNLNNFGSNEVLLPKGLMTFLSSVLEDLSDSTKKAKVNNIKKFFDYVFNTLSKIDGYKLKSSPVTEIDIRNFKGRKYYGTSKSIFELEDWMLFSEYLYCLCDKLISDIENNVSNARRSENLNGNIDIILNKEIGWWDKKIFIDSISINTIFDDLSRKSDGNNGVFLNPSLPLILLIMSKSGIRFNGVTWLDEHEWNKKIKPVIGEDGDVNEEQLVEITVSVDKVKTSHFSSHVPLKISNLIKRWIDIKTKVFGETIPQQYQSNDSSKWGELVPIFSIEGSAPPPDAGRALDALVREFKFKQIKADSSKKLNMFYRPVSLDPRFFQKISDAIKSKRNNNIILNVDAIGSDSFCAHINEEEGLYFTPILLSTELTAHSLRATIDTYLPMIVGAKDTGKLLTGQTEQVVAYYSKATPELHDKTLSIAKEIIPNFLGGSLGVNSMVKDSDFIRHKLKESGLEGINGFTYSANTSDNIQDSLASVNPNDIAVNNTHICIHGNKCPKRIRDILDGVVNCAICPDSIGMKSDFVAISAQIRYHTDNVYQINQTLETDVNALDRDRLINKREDELLMASSWLLRLRYILEIKKDDDLFVINEDGVEFKTKISSFSPKNTAEDISSRIIEVQGVPSMQSERLKVSASRISRKILQSIKKSEFDVPEYSPVEIASSLIKRVASINGFSKEKVLELISSVHDENKASNIIELLELAE